MLDWLRNSASRRLVVSIVALLVLLSAVLYYMITFIMLPYANALCGGYMSGVDKLPVLNGVGCQILIFSSNLFPELLKGIIGSAITAGFFAAIWSYVLPNEQELEDVEVLERPACKDRHMKAVGLTDFWFHDGHLANWVRNNVLPAFRQRSMDLATLEVRATVLNPMNTSVCQAYIDHIRHLPEKERNCSSVKEVQVEILATLIAFSFEQFYSPNLSMSLYFKDEIDFIRRDTNSICSFFTIVGSDTPGICINKRNDASMFYNIVKSGSILGQARCRSVDLDGFFCSGGVAPCYEVSCVKGLLEHVFGPSHNFDDSMIETALVKVRRIEGI